jgi:hypothetical protein
MLSRSPRKPLWDDGGVKAVVREFFCVFFWVGMDRSFGALGKRRGGVLGETGFWAGERMHTKGELTTVHSSRFGGGELDPAQVCSAWQVAERRSFPSGVYPHGSFRDSDALGPPRWSLLGSRFEALGQDRREVLGVGSGWEVAFSLARARRVRSAEATRASFLCAGCN